MWGGASGDSGEGLMYCSAYGLHLVEAHRDSMYNGVKAPGDVEGGKG